MDAAPWRLLICPPSIYDKCDLGMFVYEDIALDLRELAQSRIYFGRHSVGRNMLSGVEQLAAQHGVDEIRLVELDRESQLPSGSFFAHSQIGENGEPEGKIDGFAHRIRSGLPIEPSVALMKLCYVDLDPSTNVGKLFGYYRSTLDALSAEFADVHFVHDWY